jgi:hypothetical protein
MGLGVSVGQLAYFLVYNDPEAAEWCRNDVAKINRLLVANGLPAHQEPEAIPSADFGGFPYTWVYYLRRAVAFARQAPEEFHPAIDEDDATDHWREYEEESEVRTSHIICHSATEGYYAPVAFPDPLYDDAIEGVPGGILGSSYQALRELILVAPLLGIPLKDGVLGHDQAEAINAEDDESHPCWRERRVWLTLYLAMEHSITRKALVAFT